MNQLLVRHLIFLCSVHSIYTVAITRTYKLMSLKGFAYIIDERGDAVGGRYPHFSAYDLYVQGDGTLYPQRSGTHLSNQAFMGSINNVMGTKVDIDWQDGSPVTTESSEWFDVNRAIPASPGHCVITVHAPPIQIPENVERKFVLKGQQGNAVVYDLASGERTRQTYAHGYHYNMAIAQNGAVYFIPTKRALLEKTAFIEQVLNPFGFAYTLTVAGKGQPSVTLSSSDQVLPLYKGVPVDQRGGEGLTLTVYKHSVDSANSLPVSALPYNYVTWAMTHNSQSCAPAGGAIGLAADIAQAAAGYNVLQVNDQDRTPLQQLQDGVRALAFRVHDTTVNGVTNVYACHGLMISDVPPAYQHIVETALGIVFQQETFMPCEVDFARESLTNLLLVVKYFLDNNPREVVTLVINNQGTPSLMAKAFVDSGTVPYTYKHGPFTDPWPSLAQLIASNKRLVIFCTGNGQPDDYPWANSQDAYVVGTSYSLKKPVDLLAEDLMTAWLSGTLDWTHGFILLSNQCTPVLAGDKGMATVVNAADVLTRRAETLKTRLGKYPSFLSVDFYEQPQYDTIAVARAITQKTAQDFLDLGGSSALSE